MKTQLLSKTFCAALAMLAMPVSKFAVTFSGSTAGQFQNAVGPVGMVTTGQGTNNFTWGVSADSNPVNSLSFTGALFTTIPPETTFTLGQLAYHNGAIALGTEVNSVDLAVALSFTDPSGVNQSFTFPFTLITTPNTGDLDGDADSLELGLGTQSVFVVGGVSYTLDLAFGNLTGNSLGDADTFRVREQGDGTAELQGRITANIVRAPDTGSTLVLLGVALVAIRVGRRAIA